MVEEVDSCGHWTASQNVTTDIRQKQPGYVVKLVTWDILLR